MRGRGNNKSNGMKGRVTYRLKERNPYSRGNGKSNGLDLQAEGMESSMQYMAEAITKAMA